MVKVKKPTKKQLTKENDALWSAIVRRNWDGLCAVCGRPGSQSHHFFGKKSCSALRWVPENGLYMCFHDHIGLIHQQGQTEPARDALIKKIGFEKFQKLKENAHAVKKITIDMLLEVREWLKAKIIS